MRQQLVYASIFILTQLIYVLAGVDVQHIGVLGFVIVSLVSMSNAVGLSVIIDNTLSDQR